MSPPRVKIFLMALPMPLRFLGGGALPFTSATATAGDGAAYMASAFCSAWAVAFAASAPTLPSSPVPLLWPERMYQSCRSGAVMYDRTAAPWAVTSWKALPIRVLASESAAVPPALSCERWAAPSGVCP